MKENKRYFYRWIEVSDFTNNPKQHGEYSNKEDRKLGKAIKVKIIIGNN